MEYNEFFSWKPLLYADKCAAILTDEFLPPVDLHIYPTNLCNNQCRFCIMKKEQEEYPAELPKEVFEKLIEDANEMGIKAIHIAGGGEPTLYPYLPLIRNFKGKKILSTNGRKLTRDVAFLFDRIRISIDAGTQETYCQTTGNDSIEWQKLLYNVIDITHKPHHYKVGMGFVVDHKNWHDIPTACELATKLEMDFVHIRPAFYPKGSPEEIEVRKMARTIFHAGEAARLFCGVEVYNVSEKFEGFWTERKYNKCLASPLNCVVTATGELVVCLDVFIRFGNLNKQRLPEIWGSPEHHEAIKKINIDQCPRCIMNRANEIMENVFVNNNILKELL